MFSNGFDCSSTTLDVEDFNNLSDDSEDERFAGKIPNAQVSVYVLKTPKERLQQWTEWRASPAMNEIMSHFKITLGPIFSEKNLVYSTEIEWYIGKNHFRYYEQRESHDCFPVYRTKNDKTYRVPNHHVELHVNAQLLFTLEKYAGQQNSGFDDLTKCDRSELANMLGNRLASDLGENFDATDEGRERRERTIKTKHNVNEVSPKKKRTTVSQLDSRNTSCMARNSTSTTLSSVGRISVSNAAYIPPLRSSLQPPEKQSWVFFDIDLFSVIFGTAVVQDVVANFLGILCLRPVDLFEENDKISKRLHGHFNKNLKPYIIVPDIVM